MLPIGDHSLERIAICLEELLRQTFPRSREIDWILHGSPFQANGNRMHCLLPKHALICHIMISSKLLCRISIHDSVSWVPSACPCAVSSPPTYIAKGSSSQHEDQGAPIPQQGLRCPCLFCALTGQLAPSPVKEVRSSPSALKNSFVSDSSQESTLSSAYTASHKHLGLLAPSG